MSDDLRIPVVQEEAHVTKRAGPTEHVSVRTSTETNKVVVQDEVRREHVEVMRVPVEREVAEVPKIRTEGDVTIVPVLEERLVVEKRLFLVEELHLRRSVQVEAVELPAELRRTRVDIERQTIDPQEEQ
jgi:stress response protein YsnF